MITIINYGMGNLGSVQNMCKRIGVPSEITGDPEVIAKSTKLLLPGVGAFDAAMQKIADSGLRADHMHRRFALGVAALVIAALVQALDAQCLDLLAGLPVHLAPDPGEVGAAAGQPGVELLGRHA